MGGGVLQIVERCVLFFDVQWHESISIWKTHQKSMEKQKTTKQQKVQTHVPCPAFFWTLSMSLNFLFALFFLISWGFCNFWLKSFFERPCVCWQKQCPFLSPIVSHTYVIHSQKPKIVLRYKKSVSLSLSLLKWKTLHSLKYAKLN